MPAPPDEPLRLVAINAGVSDPSSTRTLLDTVARKCLEGFSSSKVAAALDVIELGPLAIDIARATVVGFPGETLQSSILRLARADALIAATPVYKAAMSGLFKSFIDLLDNDLLIAKPVILAATAGTARHAMVVDDQMRPLFAFMRSMPMPTSLFASPDDWGTPELAARVERAAAELTQFVRSGVGRSITASAWQGYQHEFGSKADRNTEISFDTDLMRLAAGGSLRP